MTERRTSARPLSTCKAILFCEKIMVDQETLRPSLINVFDTYVPPFLPMDAFGFHAFVQLSEGIGRYQIRLEVRDLTSEEEVFQTAATEIEFDDRLQSLNLSIEITSLSLVHPTTYDIVLTAEGDEIVRQRLVIAPPPQEEFPNEEATP